MSVQALAWAWAQKTGSPTRKMVLVSLANRHNADTGLCCPKVERIAWEMEINEKTVRRALAKLEEDGYIKRHRTRRQDGFFGVYHYTLQLDFASHPPVTESAGLPVTESGPEPEVSLNHSEANASALVHGTDALWAGPVTTHTLLAEVVDSAKNHDVYLAPRTKGHLATEIKRLLDDGATPDQIRAGMARMAERRLFQPSLLPNFVTEAAIPKREPLRYGRGMTAQQVLDRYGVTE